MKTEVIMPKPGFSMNEGQLNEWLVQDGAQAVSGAPLLVIESEKSATELEAPASGTLRIVKAAGEIYEVGTVLAVIE